MHKNKHVSDELKKIYSQEQLDQMASSELPMSMKVNLLLNTLTQ